MERPLERRTAARTAVVWEALQPLLGAGERAVVDIGGGTGGFAVRIAGLGHRVTLIDPSPDALAAAGRRAEEAGVSGRVTGQQGDLADLPGLVDPRSVDLVLCHGVLGIVADPAAALAGIGEVLRPGGHLSLLVSQRHAAVLARAMAGHLARALELLTSGGGDGEHRFSEEEAGRLLAGAGFEVEAVHGVRIFADLVPSGLLDREAGAPAALLDLERAAASRPEYRTVATQLHLLARR